MINAAIWLVAILVFLMIEALTYAVVSIWFAGGALGALIASACGAEAHVQVLVFLAVSFVSVFLLRCVAVKHFRFKPKKTNADRIIGQTVIITQTVDNIKNCGTALVGDVTWKVKSRNGEIISEGEYAEVTAIEGVKLIVKNKEA